MSHGGKSTPVPFNKTISCHTVHKKIPTIFQARYGRTSEKQSIGGWTGRISSKDAQSTNLLTSIGSAQMLPWSQQEQFLHINILEMRAIRCALIQFNLCPYSVILVSSDCGCLCQQAGRNQISLTNRRDIPAVPSSLRASYLLGARNVIADSQFRQNQIFPSEWSLHLSILQRILRIWNFPMFDLFATRRNKKLRLYVSPVLDNQAWAKALCQ